MRPIVRSAILFQSVIVLTGLLVATAQAQESTFADQATPLAEAKGSHPLAAFGGSNYDRVNAFGGNLSISVPLASLGGRGGLGVSVSISYNSKTWRNVRSGDTQSGTYDYPETTDWETDELSVAPGWRITAGTMTGRKFGWGTPQGNPGCQGYPNTLTTLSFVSPDGTEYSLYDTVHDGEGVYNGSGDCDNSASLYGRGTVFVTRDGTAATFISDTEIRDDPTFLPPDGGTFQFYPSGWMLLRDGMRFRVENGLVVKQQDRNGNFVTFTYDSTRRLTSVTDTLERTITIDYIEYNKWATALVEIRVKGADGEERLTRIIPTTLTDQLGTPPTFETDLFPNLDKAGTWDPILVGSIDLPSGHQWVFSYNKYGEVTRVETPAHGAIEYKHGFTGLGENFSTSKGPLIFRQVKERRTFPDANSPTAEGLTVYGDPTTSYDGTPPTDETQVNEDRWDPVVFETLPPNSQPIARTRHYFYGSPVDEYTGVRRQDGYRSWKTGKEFKTEQAGYPNGTVFERSRVETTWVQRAPLGWCSGDGCPDNDPRVTETKSILEPGGSQYTSKMEYGYDDYNNVTSEKSYDFGTAGSGSAGALRREVLRTFVTTYAGTNYTNHANHLRSLLLNETVKNGSGVVEARSEIEYDDYSSGTYSAPLDSQGYPGVTIATHASSIDPPGAPGPTHTTSHLIRGNVTKTRALTDVGGTELTSKWFQYDIYGNVVKTIDARATESGPANYTTMIDYAHGTGQEFYFAYPTSSSRPVSQAVGSPLTLDKVADYFRWTGQIKSVRGYNSADLTTFEYSDSLNRLTRVVRPSGMGETVLVYSEDDYPLAMTEKTLQATGDWIEATTIYDGLYRPVQSDREDAGQGGIVRTLTEYDVLGRPWLVTNPFRPGVPPSPTDGWTRTLYDDIGRPIKVSSFDNPPSQPPTATEMSDTGDVLTAYAGPTVTVTDQAGKMRKSRTDGLGRLVEVLEPTSLGALTISSVYTYDARSNLTLVTQADTTFGTQTRTFAYDALSRMTHSVMPEQNATISENGGMWSMKYVYDRASNLSSTTDARGISVSYTYDEMNRVRTKNYSNTVSSYKDVVYVYDDSAIPTSDINGNGALPPSPYSRGSAKGRLVAVITNPATETAQELTGAYYGYDAGGRTTSYSQLLESQHFVSTQSFNLASAVDVESYYRSASGSQQLISSVDHDYNAAGQLVTVKRTPSGGSASVVSGLMTYAPSGALGTQRMANDPASYLHHSIGYNSRLQPKSITLGASPGGADLLDLGYDYGAQPLPLDKGFELDQSKNNGNIGRITIRPGAGQAGFEQDFEYDELNRLRLAKEFAGSESALGTPSGLTVARRGPSQVDLAWNDASTGETGFEVWRRDGTSGTWNLKTTTAANAESYSDMNASDLSGYCYRVRAVTSTAQSGYSNEACLDTAVSGCVPATPTGLAASVVSGQCLQVQVTWSDVANNETGYVVERAESSSGGNYARIATLGAGANSYLDTRLNPNYQASYCYRVKAVNSAGSCESAYAVLCPGPTVTPCDYGLLLDGVNDHVQAADSATLDVTDSLTVEAWVRVFEGGVNQMLVSKRKLATTSNNGGYDLAITSNNTLVFATFKNDGTVATIVESTDTVPIGTWVHVAGILQYNYPTTGTKKVHVAINGILRTRNNPGASPTADAGTTSLQIGCALKPNGNGTLRVKGKVDEVRISNTPRYIANFDHNLVYKFTPDSNTKALWHMDEATGTTTADSSTGGNTATLVNGVEWTGGVQTLSKHDADEASKGGSPMIVDPNSGERPGSGPINTSSPAILSKTATTPEWTQEFVYDRWGNRDWGGLTSTSYPTQGLTFNRPKNQISMVDGVSTTYDAAGNMTAIREGDTQKDLSYDAENRLWKAVVTNATSGTTQTLYFTYDGEGRRVKKRNTSGGTDPIDRFVYSARGALIADYSSLTEAPTREYVYGSIGLLATADADGGIQYITLDHLGSLRLTMTNDLAVVRRQDFLPFGEALLDGRTDIPGYNGSNDFAALRQQFTSKERDVESGLDYFGSRYCGTGLGRFTSPDIPLVDQVSSSPQSWNLYSYVRNNPLNLVDPSGRSVENPGFVSAESAAAGSSDSMGSAEAAHLQRVGNTLDARAANNAVARGDNARAESIIASNSALVAQRRAVPDEGSTGPKPVGVLTIKTQGHAGSTERGRGHAWIEYTSLRSGITHTYSTYGNRGDDNGLLEDIDLGEPFLASRSTLITEEQHFKLFMLIGTIEGQGTGGWSYTCPCSCFSANAWFVTTGEVLSGARQGVGPLTPGEIRLGIIEANGGRDNAFVAHIPRSGP